MSTRVNPCSYLPRRLQIVTSLTGFVLFCIIFLGSSSTDNSYLEKVPYGPQLEHGARKVVEQIPKLPDDLPFARLNPFRQPAHTPPPEQANSSSGEARWFSDWKWRSPFSSSVTLDEERAVLPPERNRPPVYTYFDPTGRRRDKKSQEAEQDLLQIWRRAWWAKGFKPIVLGRSEAMNNPMYRRIQALELEAELEMELMRWLAWGNMGTGILSNWLALPMASYDDPLLTFLRHGEYPELTQYTGLGNGLFIGSKNDIDKALTLSGSKAQTAKSVAEMLPEEFLKQEPQSDGIAFYNTSVINEKYAKIGDKIANETTRGDGLAELPILINSHLHMIWQNSFASGIAVLKPLSQNSTKLVEPAIDIARNLSQCPDSPIATSCPPNRPKCKPCVSSHPMLISTPPVFRNTSTLFTIATVPHPYTIQTLIHTKDELDLKYIRRVTKRDSWILAATKELLGTGLSSFARLGAVKEAVASPYGSARSYWLTAERPPDHTSAADLAELDWNFGFQLPRGDAALKSGKSETPVPGLERRPPPPREDFSDGPLPSPETLNKQEILLEKAKRYLRVGETGGQRDAVNVRAMVEAWNLADTEAWKFVRAWNARRRMERRKWEEEEEAFQGKGTYDRWKDYIT